MLSFEFDEKGGIRPMSLPCPTCGFHGSEMVGEVKDSGADPHGVRTIRLRFECEHGRKTGSMAHRWTLTVCQGDNRSEHHIRLQIERGWRE